MKKILALLIAMFLVSILALSTITTAVDMEISLTANGVGVMDRTLLVQTESGYGGLKLTENMYSSHMGMTGPSNVNYSSALDLYTSTNCIDENKTIAELSYISTAYTTIMKRKIYAKNYDIGAVTGVNIVGASATDLDVNLASSHNYVTFGGLVIGKTKLSHMVVHPSTRIKMVKDVTELDGEFNIDYEVFANAPIGVGTPSDWLGCP